MCYLCDIGVDVDPGYHRAIEAATVRMLQRIDEQVEQRLREQLTGRVVSLPEPPRGPTPTELVEMVARFIDVELQPWQRRMIASWATPGATMTNDDAQERRAQGGDEHGSEGTNPRA